MDTANAFIGREVQPTDEELFAALGACAGAWKDFVAWMGEEKGVGTQEWKSYSVKYGWTVQLKLKKRTIVHLSPCRGCIVVLFILSDRAVQAARQAKLSKSVAGAIDAAPRYPEGTGVRLVVKGPRDLAATRKLVAVKLAN